MERESVLKRLERIKTRRAIEAVERFPNYSPEPTDETESLHEFISYQANLHEKMIEENKKLREDNKFLNDEIIKLTDKEAKDLDYEGKYLECQEIIYQLKERIKILTEDQNKKLNQNKAKPKKKKSDP